METDEHLVDAARSGSEAAFNTLVLRYQDKLFRFLMTRCASHADAEDTVQDTFVSAYRYLDSFDPRWRFSTWLYRIAIRNATRQYGRSSSPDVEIVDDIDPLAHCIASSERENLWLTAKGILNVDAFWAMWLHYVEDMRIKDVARALNRSVPWVKVTIFRARQRLKIEMRDASAVEAGDRVMGGGRYG